MNAADWIAIFVAIGALIFLIALIAVGSNEAPPAPRSAPPTDQMLQVDCIGHYQLTDAGWEDVSFSIYPADYPSIWRPDEAPHPLTVEQSLADPNRPTEPWEDAFWAEWPSTWPAKWAYTQANAEYLAKALSERRAWATDLAAVKSHEPGNTAAIIDAWKQAVDTAERLTTNPPGADGPVDEHSARLTAQQAGVTRMTPLDPNFPRFADEHPPTPSESEKP